MKHLDSFRFAVLESTSLTSLHSALADLLRAIRRGALRLVYVSIIGGVILVPAQAHAFHLGKAINRAAINVGKTVHKAAHDTGRAVQTAAHDTGRAIETATHDTGRAVQTATHDTGRAIETATHDTGRAIETAAHDTGHYIEEHPLEAALAIAMIGGGAYLVAFQDFNFAVSIAGKSVTLIQGGTVTGGVTAGAGAGGLAAAASTGPRTGSQEVGKSDAKGDGAVQSKTKPPTSPTLALGAAPNGIAQGVGPSGSSALDRTRPLSDFDARIKYGQDTLEWIRRDKVLQNFDATQYPSGPSPVELRLMEAARRISEIPDSEADRAAKKQADDRRSFLENVLKGTWGDVTPGNLIKEFVGEAAKHAVGPTKLGDGQAAAREHNLKELQQQIDEFRLKRFVQEDMARPKAPASPASPASSAPIGLP